MRVIKFRSIRYDDEMECYRFYYFEKDRYYNDNNETVEYYMFNWNNAEQFTGLKDKNGKEIYENDIVNFRPMKKYKIDVMVSKVVFKNNCWCLENNKTYLKDNFSLTGVEVIGNIHENPELSEKND